MSPTRTAKLFTLSPVVTCGRALAGDLAREARGPRSRSRYVVSEVGSRPAQSWVSAASSRARRVPAVGCIVGTHAAEPSSRALRVALRVLSDQGLTAPHAGAGSRLVSHTIRPEQGRRRARRA